LVEELIAYVGNTGGEDMYVQVDLHARGNMSGYSPIPAPHKDGLYGAQSANWRRYGWTLIR
jgi:hypothetical protein